MRKPTEYKYLAFISYRHNDMKWARWIQGKLESYVIPSYLRDYEDIPSNLRPIFRDETDLPLGILSDNIRQALDVSRYLIVICSSNTPGSVYVQDEVYHFLKKNNIDKVIPLIVDNSKPEECYPKGLPLDCLAANVTEISDGYAFIKVVARLLGNLEPDSLWHRYAKAEEEQNNQLRILKERASVNKAMSLQESGQNLLMARVALDIIDSDIKNGWEPLPEVERFMRASLFGRQDELFPLLSSEDNLLFAPDGKSLLIWNRYTFSVLQLDPYETIIKDTLHDWDGGPVFDANNRYLAIADTESIHLVNYVGRKQVLIKPEAGSGIASMRFLSNADDDTLIVVYSTGIVSEYDPLSGACRSSHAVDLQQSYLIDAFISEDSIILRKKEDISTNILGLNRSDWSLKFVDQTDEGVFLHSEDSSKLLYSTGSESFVLRDLVNGNVYQCSHRGHPEYVSNEGTMRFRNDDDTIDIIGLFGWLYAGAPFYRFWLSGDDKACAYAIKKDKAIYVYFNPDCDHNAVYIDGLIDIARNSILIKKYSVPYLETLKIVGRRFVVIGGEFGVDIYDIQEHKIVNSSEFGDDASFSSDYRHLIIDRSMSNDPSLFCRYNAFLYPVSIDNGRDILTVDSDGSPIYYDLSERGRIEVITNDGIPHGFSLKSDNVACSLSDVCFNRQLAAFRVNDRPGFIKTQNGLVYDDSYVIIINLKEFNIVKTIANRAFQQKGRIQFSYDGKQLLAESETLDGTVLFSYDIITESLTSIPINSRKVLFDRTSDRWAVADKTTVTVYSSDGEEEYGKTMEKQLFSMRFIDDKTLFSYPYVFDLDEGESIALEGAPELVQNFKYDIDKERDIAVVAFNDMEYHLSVFVWQLSSGKLLMSLQNVSKSPFTAPHIGRDVIYLKDLIIPFPGFDELRKSLSGLFSGYELDNLSRETFYLVD